MSIRRFITLAGYPVIAAMVLACSPAFAEERDPLQKRVPLGERADVAVLKNPVAPTPDTIAKGKALFEGKGLCVKCHGSEGRGNGRLAEFLDPSPRNFANIDWQRNRTDGELLWVIKNGSEGTGMASMAPAEISIEEAWHVILYIRTFGQTPH